MSQLETLQKNFRGQMTEGEFNCCLAIRRLLADTLASRRTFAEAMGSLSSGVQMIAEHKLEVEAAWADGLEAVLASPSRDTDNEQSRAPSQKEAVFLRDLDGLIDYATRNDLSFQLVLRVVANDVEALRSNSWSLEAALSRCILPQSTGWAELNQGSVGEPADESEG